MFNAPEIILDIPEISTLYKRNDKQAIELDEALNASDDNTSFDQMRESGIKRWEKIFNIIPLDDDTLEERRLRVHAKSLEKAPYSRRIVKRRISNLCEEGCRVSFSEDRLSVDVKIGLKSRRMQKTVESFLEDALPLNMTYVVSVLFNQYFKFSHLKYKDVKVYKCSELRERIFE